MARVRVSLSGMVQVWEKVERYLQSSEWGEESSYSLDF